MSNIVVIHVADYAAPYTGNFMRALDELEIRCAAMGWRQILVLPQRAATKGWCRALREGGKPVFFLDDSSALPRLTWDLCRLSIDGDAVLFHTHFSRYDIGAWLAVALLRARRRKAWLVWHAHTDLGEDRSFERKIKDYVKYRTLGRCVVAIPVSQHVHDQLVAAGFPLQRLRLVPNGIDLSRAVARVRTVNEVCRDCGLQRETPLLLLFGWDPELKGVDTALEAAGALMAAGKPIILGLVGTDALSDYVRQRCGDVLPSWVRLMPPTEHVADYYQAAAIFISASRKEGLPYSVCEAMANALPVVLSDIPGQAFAHGSSGAVFFPPGDATALRKALDRVLEWTATKRVEAVLQNQALIKQGYNVAKWADRMAAIYRELADQSSEGLSASGLIPGG